MPPGFVPPKVVIEAPEGRRGYVSDLIASFFFPSHVGNLVTFMIVWLLLAMSITVLPFAGIVGAGGIFIIAGWYSAFRFGVIAESAAGKEELPDFSFDEGWWDGVVSPFLNWVGSWVIVCVPAVIVMWIESGPGWSTVGETLGLLSGGVAAIIQNTYLAGSWIQLAALCLGMFVWPFIALCFALGSGSGLGRLDLLIETMVRTLPVYVLTVALAYLPVVVELSAKSVQPGFATAAMFTGAALYLEIVGLRAIGLYYHHFKEKFAWSWE
jgi:hypothetical protein